MPLCVQIRQTNRRLFLIYIWHTELQLNGLCRSGYRLALSWVRDLVGLLSNEDADYAATDVAINGCPTACQAVGDRLRLHLRRHVFSDWQSKYTRIQTTVNRGTYSPLLVCGEHLCDPYLEKRIVTSLIFDASDSRTATYCGFNNHMFVLRVVWVLLPHIS